MSTTTFIDLATLSAAVDAFFQRQALQCPAATTKYKVQDNFHGAPYWVESLRGSRFEATLVSGILYRPEIVDEIVNSIEQCLDKLVVRGLMVKGPQGVGKSHSLINTVLKLQSTGNYLVTFLPDGEKWDSARFLIKYICNSFGSTPQDLGIRYQSRYDEERVLEDLVAAVDKKLEELGKGKKWVFIFDQINKIFNKPENNYSKAKDVSGLAFPFRAIGAVMKAGRITSVISASANNEMAYKEKHENFDDYNHRTTMTGDELCSSFDNINETTLGEVLEHTNGVPLYASMYAGDPLNFEDTVDESVWNSIRGLRLSESGADDPDWQFVLVSICCCLLGTLSTSGFYDKKFLVRIRKTRPGGRTLWEYQALFPAALAAYRKYLWKELMQYVERNEQTLLGVCSSPDTTNDTRGRLFETMVIRRCQSIGVGIQVGEDTQGTQLRQPVAIDASPDPIADLFDGKQLKDLTIISPNRVYVPTNPNFPAIDLIWKNGRSVFGVQVHVSSHDDVANSFFGMCKAAKWFEIFDEVHLLYLSPENGVKDLVASLVQEPKFYGMTTRGGSASNPPFILRSAITKSSVSCLKNLQWTNGCSLS